MLKARKDKIRNDPILWKKFQDSRSKERKAHLERLKENPIEYEEYKERIRGQYHRRTEPKKQLKAKKRSMSPYWQVSGHKRYKRRFFASLASDTNQRCRLGKRLRAIDLWSILKNQRGVCPLTGEKLTRENISIDHITPVSKNGTNDLSNLRFLTLTANSAKGSMTDAEFFLFCQKIASRIVVN